MTIHDPPPRASLDVEAQIADACRAGEHDAAIALAFRAYGTEILTFLRARMRSNVEGEEAFSMFAEDLVTALPRFEHRCSVRAYLYTVARNAAVRWAQQKKKPEEPLGLERSSRLSMLVARVRTETDAYRRTEVKDKVRRLRERLDPEDQTLLILRIDRELPWKEVAMIMTGDGEALAGDALERKSAALRKRFEVLKNELRELALMEGLITG